MESASNRLDQHGMLEREPIPELPGITILAWEMQEELTGKTISGRQVLQPKCPN